MADHLTIAEIRHVLAGLLGAIPLQSARGRSADDWTAVGLASRTRALLTTGRLTALVQIAGRDVVAVALGEDAQERAVLELALIGTPVDGVQVWYRAAGEWSRKPTIAPAARTYVLTGGELELAIVLACATASTEAGRDALPPRTVRSAVASVWDELDRGRLPQSTRGALLAGLEAVRARQVSPTGDASYDTGVKNGADGAIDAVLELLQGLGLLTADEDAR